MKKNSEINGENALNISIGDREGMEEYAHFIVTGEHPSYYLPRLITLMFSNPNYKEKILDRDQLLRTNLPSVTANNINKRIEGGLRWSKLSASVNY